MPSLRELTEYHKPTSIDDALKLLRRPDIRLMLIGGGAGVVADASHNVQAVIDLSGLNLSYINATEQGIAIGATTTLQQMLEDENIRNYADGVLIKAILDTASLNTRNQASIAGSIVEGAGNSPLLTTLLALGTSLHVRDDQDHTFPLSDWQSQSTALIIEVMLPRPQTNMHAAYEKVARTPADLPIVCVAATGIVEAGKLRVADIAIGGVADRPIELPKLTSSIEQAIQVANQTIQPKSDYFATADYRHEMVNVLIRRVLTNLAG